MSYTDEIYDLEFSGMSNREIADKVGCSIRLVQMRLGNTRERNDMVQREVRNRLPKILIFDLETSPMEGYFWGLFKQRPSIAQVKKDWSILCWCAKWLFEPEIIGQSVTWKEAHNREDKSIIKGLWDLIEEADIVVAHNGDNFDVRVMNARYIVNGLGPNTPFKSIDTRKVSSKNFRHASHKLEWLCKRLDVKRKKNPQGYELWTECVDGKKTVARKALDQMMAYCKDDVGALEDLFIELSPWVKGINAGVYAEADQEICPNPACGSIDVEFMGYYTTTVSKFRSFRCRDCGAIGRLRKTTLSKDKRDRLAAPIAG